MELGADPARSPASHARRCLWSRDSAEPGRAPPLPLTRCENRRAEHSRCGGRTLAPARTRAVSRSRIIPRSAAPSVVVFTPQREQLGRFAQKHTGVARTLIAGRRGGCLDWFVVRRKRIPGTSPPPAARTAAAKQWLCPACDTQIRHYEPHPRPRIVYRCHICRLELVVHTETGALVLAPMHH
jgi:hypothetical protein